MRSSIPTLHPLAVHAPDLAQVAGAEAPVLTVYLETEATADNASQHTEKRWRSLRQSLTDQGAGAEALAHVDPLVRDAHLHGPCLAVVARPEGVRHVEHGPWPVAHSAGWWAPLPRLAPILEWRQTVVPHVVVLADRRGADLFATGYGGPQLHREAGGGEDPIRKSAPGGWSQRRYQQRAENTWEHNADDVTRQVVRLAHGIDARLVIVAGDVRALQMLRESLPRELIERVVEVAGGRAADGSEHERIEAVARAVSEVVARETAAVLERFREERGQHDKAVDGAAATLDALARGQVEILLLRDDPENESTAWFGSDPTPVGATAQDLSDMGVEHPQEGRLADVAVRAGLGSGAGVRIVPEAGGPRHGLGALLRWSAP